ncbi:MFS transporter [Actinomadura nitritigenes]|uniref:MFS transporter n=1 Tax=Actinomadura nitritigenes TaxID=134602 RepID=UPI003D8C1445
MPDEGERRVGQAGERDEDDVAALSAATARLDRRAVLATLAGLLAAADLGSAAAPGLPALLASRVLVGVAIGGVWAIAGGLAARLVPERSAGTATSVVFGGISVASVVGVPAVALVGDLAGWRAAFAVAGALSLAACAALAVLLPPLPGTGPAGLRNVPRVLRAPRARAGLVVTLLLVTGHFAAYTYVRPVLERVSGVDPDLVSTLLLYGVAGVAGNFATGTAAARGPRRTLLALAAVLAPTVLLFPLAGRAPLPAIVLLVPWGAAYGGVSVTLQTWLLRAAPPHAAEPASALCSSPRSTSPSRLGRWRADAWPTPPGSRVPCGSAGRWAASPWPPPQYSAAGRNGTTGRPRRRSRRAPRACRTGGRSRQPVRETT